MGDLNGKKITRTRATEGSSGFVSVAMLIQKSQTRINNWRKIHFFAVPYYS
ncbi:MAG: hypothetical protein RJA53_1655 [Bacteroidota bacterium]|jgi:hypothetical protein